MSPAERPGEARANEDVIEVNSNVLETKRDDLEDICNVVEVISIVLQAMCDGQPDTDDGRESIRDDR